MIYQCEVVMRCFLTLLAMMVLSVVSLPAQITYHPPVDTGSLGFQIPDRTIEELRDHKPVIMFWYSPSAGIPTRTTRYFYAPSNPYIKDSLLLDYVAANPCQTSWILKQLHRPIDPLDPKTRWQPVGWVRADLDADGRVIRLWGEDAGGRYWVWRGSLPFSGTAPSGSNPVVE
jgi:hypothetical protein